MVTFAILVTDHCLGSGIYSILDTLTTANYLQRRYLGIKEDFCEFKMFGKAEYQTAYNGQSIGPLLPFESLERPDILILPGFIEAVTSLRRAKPVIESFQDWTPRIQQWHNEGSLIAAACSGNLLLAAAGLAKERPITCHWATETIAKSLFPHEIFQTDRMFFDHGDIVSIGGASSVGQLMLYLIERFGGRELALYCSKMLLIEPERGEQAPFALFSPNKRHDDNQVKKMQEWLETHFSESINVTEIGHHWGISERQLGRRFRKATGETPGSYLQKIRLEHIKRGLETTERPSNNIIWDAGYEDVSSFRRRFKKETGMTMKEYRKRFGTQATL